MNMRNHLLKTLKTFETAFSGRRVVPGGECCLVLVYRESVVLGAGHKFPLYRCH